LLKQAILFCDSLRCRELAVRDKSGNWRQGPTKNLTFNICVTRDQLDLEFDGNQKPFQQLA
jgi:hypothetical protein